MASMIVLAMMLVAVSSLPVAHKNNKGALVQPAILAYLALAPEGFNLKEEIFKAQQDMQQEQQEQQRSNRFHLLEDAANLV